jgi:hypothetical protein
MVEISQGDYKIYNVNDSLLLQNLSYNKILKIDKLSNFVSEIEQNILNKVTPYDIIRPHAILGIIQIKSIEFLVYVKVAKLIGKIEKSEIFKIKEVDLIPICDETTAINLSTDIKSLVQGIRKIFPLGFFYSFQYDLTNPKSKQVKNKLSDIFECAERKYFWNFNMYNKFLSNERNNINKIWCVVCICGFVGMTEQKIGNAEIGFYLISRRSVYHAGTRYNARGIDDDGNVANYIESEQILKCSDHLLSFIQIRGSAPIFFKEAITVQAEITRNPELAQPAFKRHIADINKDFSMIFLINLMNCLKPNEQTITQNLENIIKTNSIKNLRYHYFDLQNECKYDNYEKVDILMKNIESVLNIFKFFSLNNKTGEIHKEQIGVIRTNCLDCLDRTNLIQTRIGWKIIEIQVSFLKLYSYNFLISIQMKCLIITPQL